VSTIIKQPSVGCVSSHFRPLERRRAGKSKIAPDIVLRGGSDIRERVACALSAKPDSVTVDRYGYSMSKLMAQCWGKWGDKRFFAKILLANPYPIPARFSAPWETPRGATTPVRAIAEQIEIEWNMTLKMRALSRDRSVPAPLGRSSSARTIVWEEAGGVSLVHALKWSRWKSSMARAGTQALFRAGAWLRRVHETSHRGTEIIEPRDLVRTATSFMRQKENAAGHYDRMASRILEASLREMSGTGAFAAPVALTHGDFCLSNLLWDNTGGQLGVIDFELSDFRPVWQDLFALTADLRSRLLNPLIPKSVIDCWKQSFWQGYGPASPPVVAFVKAVALARVFYHDLSRLLTRRERRGWIAGVNAQLYRTFLERRIIAQRLDLPSDLAPSHHH
jgi:Phosphotransferase enzyme family